MAFKEVAGLNVDVSYALGKADKNGVTRKQVEGYYLGCRKTKNDFGESSLHVFQTAEGNHGIWGSKDIDTKLQSVNPGAMVRVTANGLGPKRPGKNPMKL